MMLGTPYGPDGYSPGHTHRKSAFIYATVPTTRLCLGAIRSQVNDAPVTTYKVTQSFSDLPGDPAPMPARRSRPSSSRCSWWTRTRWN